MMPVGTSRSVSGHLITTMATMALSRLKPFSKGSAVSSIGDNDVGLCPTARRNPGAVHICGSERRQQWCCLGRRNVESVNEDHLVRPCGAVVPCWRRCSRERCRAVLNQAARCPRPWRPRSLSHDSEGPLAVMPAGPCPRAAERPPPTLRPSPFRILESELKRLIESRRGLAKRARGLGPKLFDFCGQLINHIGDFTGITMVS